MIANASAPSTLDPFFALVGDKRWRQRLAEIRDLAGAGPRAGQAIRQRHVLELSLEKLRRQPDAPMSATETLLEAIAREIPLIAASLTPRGRSQLTEQLQLGLTGQNTLVPVFHLVRSAMLQRSRGFTVSFSGLEEGTPHDLLLTRDQIEAEVACDVVSAENGRGVHRGAWFRLADRIDPDLQTWLAAHPGRYLLKMTLPGGLRGGLHASELDSDGLATLHQRIRALLESERRTETDAAMVLRLDPLLLTAAQADELGIMSSLRREFGHEAHLSVTAAGAGVFVMAARAGQENEVATALRRRMM